MDSRLRRRTASGNSGDGPRRAVRLLRLIGRRLAMAFCSALTSVTPPANQTATGNDSADVFVDARLPVLGARPRSGAPGHQLARRESVDQDVMKGPPSGRIVAVEKPE